MTVEAAAKEAGTMLYVAEVFLFSLGHKANTSLLICSQQKLLTHVM